MRAAFGLLTALPLQWDPDDIGGAWGWTGMVGLAIGVAWLLFHQAFSQVGGPFVAAGGTLLVHQALTGARPLRGLVAVVEEVVDDPEARPGRGLPAVGGAGTAVVTLLVLVMSALLILLDVAPAVLVVIPLVGRSAQALLLGEGDVGVGLPPPSVGQRVAIISTTLAALVVAPVLATVVRPVRLDVSVLEYLATGVGAIVVTVAVCLVARAWLRARLGPLDADGWHALGAVADVTALAVIASAIS